MKSVLRILLLSIGSLLLVSAALLGFLLATESGTRFLITRVLPEPVKVGAVEGRLIGPLVVHGVRLDTAALSVVVERAELRWRPGRMLARRLQVDRLQLDGVTVTARQPSEEAPPQAKAFELPTEISTPLGVEVRELLVNGFAYRGAPASEPLVIDTVRASLGASDTTFNVERLDVSAPSFDIDAAAEVDARENYPLAATVNVALRPHGYAPLRSITRIDGSLEAIRIHEAVGTPYNLEAEATISSPFDELSVDISATLAGVNPAAIRLGLPQAMMNLEAHAEGALSDLALRASLTTVHQQQRLQAELLARMKGDQLNIDSFSLYLPEHGSRVDARGRVRLAGNFDTDASLAWRNLKWPLIDDPDYESASGRAGITGSLDEYRLSTNADLMLPGDVPLVATVSGTGSRENLDADLRVDVLDGRMEGTANVWWQPLLKANVSLEGNDVDPAAFSPDWPGQLDFALRAAASVAQQETRARLETLTVNGELRGEPVEVESEGAYEAGAFVLERLRAQLGATRITAHGRYADTADFEWQLESEDLGELLPAAAGTVTSEGAIGGSPPQLAIDATLSASELRYGELGIGSLELVADVDLTDRQPSKVDLRVEGITSETLDASLIELGVDGRLAAHQASVTAETSRGSADLHLDGQLREPFGEHPQWLFSLTDATVAYPELRPWRLGGAAEGRLGAAEISVQRHCWTSAPAKLCLAGQRTAEQTEAEFSLDELDFDYFAAMLPEGLELTGNLSGRGAVIRRPGAPLQAEVALRTGNGTLAITGDPLGGDGGGQTPLLDLQPSQLSLILDEGAVDASADLNFGQGRIDLQAALAASKVPLIQRQLDGRLLVDVPDIAFITAFVPDVEDLQGNVNGRLEFAGTPERPRLAGRIVLADGALRSPAAGIRLRDLRATLEGRGDSIGVDASVRSGGGSLELGGELAFGGTPSPTSLDIAGENFQLLGNEEARVFISPDLNVESGAREVRITGVVRVPRAAITPQDMPESAVTVSEDVVLMRPADDETATVEDPAGRPVRAEVLVVLGDDVRFEGFGLKARFEGDTTVIQEPDQPVTGTGEIVIAEGEYRAYGQGLVIEEGKILFAGGPVTEPALDVRAVRRPAEDILVGSRVRGTMEEPEFTLFSEPPMSQQEQLSWLVLGRSLEEAPAGESSALAQASLALGVKGGNFLAENIGSNLGVDEFGIETGSGEAGAASDPADAALVIGKYLSPELYLSYGIGLFNPISVLTMEYEINRRLKLVTESSSESTGADLVYSFERGE